MIFNKINLNNTTNFIMCFFLYHYFNMSSRNSDDIITPSKLRAKYDGDCKKDKGEAKSI